MSKKLKKSTESILYQQQIVDNMAKLAKEKGDKVMLKNCLRKSQELFDLAVKKEMEHD